LQFDSTTGVLSGTPTDADSGQSLELAVLANDGTTDAVSAASLTVNVIDANQQPNGISLDSYQVQERTPGAIVGTLTTSDPDAADVDFNYSVDDSRFEIDENGVLKVSTAAGTVNSSNLIDIDQETQINLQITTTDSAASSYTTTFTLDVIDINENPQLQFTPENPQVSEGQPFDLSSVVFTDPENDALSRAITLANGDPLPEWLIYSAELNTLSVSNAPSDVDDITVAMIVNDGKGGTTTENIVIKIERKPEIAAALPSEPEPTIERPPEAEQPAPTIEVSEAIPEENIISTEGLSEEESFETERKLKLIEERESVDLAALIKPLERVNLVDIATVDNTITSINKKTQLLDVSVQSATGNLFDLSAAFEQGPDIEFGDLASEFDRQREEIAEQTANTQSLIGRSFTISSGRSITHIRITW